MWEGGDVGESSTVGLLTAHMFEICSGEFSHVNWHHLDTDAVFMPRAAQILEVFLLSDVSPFYSVRGSRVLTI